MSLVIAWVAFPLLGAAACVGWGLLAQLATGRALRGTLLAPLGLAAIVVAGRLLTAAEATAPLSVPVVAAGGAAGLLLGRRRLRATRIDPWLAGAVAVVFLVYAAPVLLSGSATFAGYGQLGDIADHFVIADAMLDTGGTTADPAASAYEMTVAAYPGQGYPTGMHTALGSLRALAGQDVAWVFQPFLALVMALSALALVPLLEPVLRTRAARAGAVAIAALPALTYGYALQGAIKELGAIWALALLGGLLPWYAGAAPGPRRVVPVVLAAAAGIGVIGVAAAPWLGPLLVAYLAVALRRAGRWRPRAAALEAAAFALPALLVSLPVLSQLRIYVDVVVDVVTRQSELGNLLRPLSLWQALPAWPSLDFRLAPQTAGGWLAVGAGAVAVALGAVALLRRPERHWALVAWLLTGAIGWAYVTAAGSPWSDAKALAILAPAVALTAAVGVLALVERGLRAEGGLLVLLLAGAMLWSIGLQARGASLAPRERLDELASLGQRLRGPTLHPQFEPFAKHFLRDGDPDSLTEPYPGYVREPLRRPGVAARPLGASYDLDELAPAYVRRFRTIVVRRGPASRPPAIYHRVWRGRWYEAWERPASAQRRWLGSVAAGAGTSPGGRPDCAAVRRLAATARRAGAQLLAAPRARSVVWPASQAAPLPAGWGPDGADPQTLRAYRAGAVGGRVRVAVAGEYTVWLASSLGAEVTVSVDARDVGRARNAINPRGQYVSFGTVRLGAGAHTVALRRDGPGVRPGAEGGSRLVGAFVLEPAGAGDRALLAAAPARAGSLCRRDVDWVDAVLPQG